MILEPLEAAKARGARIYCEICGLGMSSDAHHLTQPLVDGPARAMRGALKDAGMAPEEIGYINAHGTGTPGNDPVESQAIRLVFGAHADKLAVSSTKSMHGHALAQQAHSKPSPRFSRYITASCRPPRTTTNAIPSATSIISRTSLVLSG